MQASPPRLYVGYPSPVVPHDVVRVPDGYSHLASFKYRLWFIWYIWPTGYRMGSTESPPWPALICGADADGDLWCWEDADEMCIQEFAIEELRIVEDLALDSFPQMPLVYWDDASRALEARRSRPTASAGPLAHLTPQNRLRFIAWLIVAGPMRKAQIPRRGDFQSLIKRWGGTCPCTAQMSLGQKSARFAEFPTFWPPGWRPCSRCICLMIFGLSLGTMLVAAGRGEWENICAMTDCSL